MRMHRRGGGIALMMLVSSMHLASTIGVFAGQQPQSESAWLKPNASATDADPDQTKSPQHEEQRDPKVRGIKEWVEQRSQTLTLVSERERGFSPSAGTIVAGSGLAAGVRYKHLDAFTPDVGFEAGGMFSFRRYRGILGAAIGVLHARSSTVELAPADRRVSSLSNACSTKKPGSAAFLDVRYRNYPQHIYYGDGLGSLEADRADYSLSGTSIEGVWQRQFVPSIGLSIRGGVLDLHVGSGTNRRLVNFEERFSPAAIAGALDQPLYVTLGAGLVRDTAAACGTRERDIDHIALRRFESGGVVDRDFTRLTFDLRGYAKPVTSRGVVALRGLLLQRFHRQRRTDTVLSAAVARGRRHDQRVEVYRFQDQARRLTRTDRRISLARPSLRRDCAVHRCRQRGATAVTTDNPFVEGRSGDRGAREDDPQHACSF